MSTPIPSPYLISDLLLTFDPMDDDPLANIDDLDEGPLVISNLFILVRLDLDTLEVVCHGGFGVPSFVLVGSKCTG